jgi:two-component system, NarL family, nitrate/nitrite response regulator NarL
MPDIRVLIVSGDALARSGLATLLAGQPDISVTGQLPGEAVNPSSVAAYHPDVVLWDLGWDLAKSLEQLTEQAENLPPVVALVPDNVMTADVWASGVRGLLPRESAVAVIDASLSSAALGLVVYDPILGAPSGVTRDKQPALAAEPLTPREHEVLQLLAEGLPNKTIAQRLRISEHTVKFHVNTILGKLGAQSRTEAVTRAARSGLILL